MAKTIKYKGSAYKDIDPELLKEYRRLADRADKRLLRLERLAETDKDFDTVLEYAYKKATDSARMWGSTSVKARFAINPPKTEQDIRLKIKDIESFLEKPTSTKSGIVRSYKKKADNLNKLLPKGSQKLTWQDYKKYFDQAEAQNIDSKFGYRTLTKAFSLKAKYDKRTGEDWSNTFYNLEKELGKAWDDEELAVIKDKLTFDISEKDLELAVKIYKAKQGQIVKFTSDVAVNKALNELYSGAPQADW